jgi:hypothetical protein
MLRADKIEREKKIYYDRIVNVRSKNFMGIFIRFSENQLTYIMISELIFRIDRFSFFLHCARSIQNACTPQPSNVSWGLVIYLKQSMT